MRDKVLLQERAHVLILVKAMCECAYSTGTNKSLMTAPLIHVFPDPVSNAQNHLPIPNVRVGIKRPQVSFVYTPGHQLVLSFGKVVKFLRSLVYL